MNQSRTLNRIQEFAPKNISVNEFLDLLQTTSRSRKMNIMWRTEGSADGSGRAPHVSTHLMWWDSGEYVGGEAGGSDTKELQNQLNLQVTPGSGNWRTLSYDNIIRFAYRGKLYNIV